MSWGLAALYFLSLPVSILVFRAFVTGGMARLLPGGGMGVGFLKLGIVLATCILGVGFVGSGYALIGLLNYTAIEDQGIRQVHFRRPEQRQVWKDLVGAHKAVKTLTKYSQGVGAKETHTDGVALHFREGGRWKVTLYLWSDEFPESDYKAFSDWLRRRLGPQEP